MQSVAMFLDQHGAMSQSSLILRLGGYMSSSNSTKHEAASRCDLIIRVPERTSDRQRNGKARDVNSPILPAGCVYESQNGGCPS
jgi:hypothetical protein